jgi:hypothetical protein
MESKSLIILLEASYNDFFLILTPAFTEYPYVERFKFGTIEVAISN